MSETNTSYSYELNADGSARITSYQGDAVFLTVPTELDGHKVIDIGRFAFYGLPNLKHVKLPEGVVTVFVNAFYGCPELETIELPSTIDN
ncbi:MAG: leucine-rich repeat protein, partial [Clostridia bacterium]|nr:leucine-rich repeat protein [Clostridia bacterium]